MALLTARRLGSGAALFAFTGCSLALDTAALQKGNPGGSGSSTTSGGDASVGDDATPTPTDAAGDIATEASACTEPGQEPCNRCLATNCCPQSSECTRDTRCNAALVALQQCRADARTKMNPRVATAACNASFAQNGGTPATALLTCMMMSCQVICAG